jgi:hypothetical protein
VLAIVTAGRSGSSAGDPDESGDLGRVLTTLGVRDDDRRPIERN